MPPVEGGATSPAEEECPGVSSGESGRHRPRRVRCEGCLEVLETATPWDDVTCGCGALGLSGIPWRPRISWTGRPGTGWSDVTDQDPAPESTATDEDGRKLTPFGYRPAIRSMEPPS